MQNDTELRAVVADESLPTHERKGAALCLVRLSLAAIPEPSDSDEEVQRLREPWPRDSEQQRTIADMFAKATEGRSIQGYAASAARAAVLAKRKRERLAQLAADTAEDVLIRDAAALELSGPSARRA